MPGGGIRRYEARARSTDTFGRVLVSCREQHLVVDGPVDNGCPGEAITPGEAFLAAVAACGVELLQVIARDRDIGLGRIRAAMEGHIDRDDPIHPDHTLFNAVRLDLELEGVTDTEGEELVEAFTSR